MTDDKIAEIRARHSRDDRWRNLPSMICPQAHDDRALLLAEIERLNKDLATQQGCCDGAAAQDAHVRQEREEHRAEVERLRREIKNLREAMQNLAERLEVDPSGTDKIDDLEAEIERLRAALRWYADPRNHFPVERRSPGDPDPAVVFVEEPPIMRDGGKRAREALEVKP